MDLNTTHNKELSLKPNKTHNFSFKTTCFCGLCSRLPKLREVIGMQFGRTEAVIFRLFSNNRRPEK